ncbi:MAG: GTPase HflX [bacterium]
MASKKPTSVSDMRPKTLIVGVYAPGNKIKSMQHYFDEFLSLIKTLGLQYDESYFTKVREIEKNNYLTKGKLQELVEFCDKHAIEEVIFSDLLSPLQERNLEDALNCPVFDREKIILEIFKKSAHSSEGKIQIEIAELNFERTRLLGKGKEYAQQAGYVGTRGPGETISEEIRRQFDEKFRQANKKLETLQKSRTVQRKQRLKTGKPQLCIIGYTNAGKSSLLNQLTKSNILAENKLFATLDTTTRELFLGENKQVLISDTVGFISQLPHSLIEAFKSTLDELQYASLLLHVIDLSNPAWIDQINVVQKTLHEIKVDKPILYVFNKIDSITQETLETLEPELHAFQPHVSIHTTSKEGIQPLLDYLKTYKF